MIFIKQIGPYKVVEQGRMVRSPKRGLRGEWKEYQVRRGRKVLARHDNFLQAEKDATARNEADWDDIGRELKAWETAKGMGGYAGSPAQAEDLREKRRAREG